MDKEIKTIRGVRDLLPEELEKWQFAEEKAVSLFKSFGFEEIRIPIIEEAALFQRSVGTYTDIVQKEMYIFSDKKGRVIALRPEATAGVVRAYIEHRMFDVKKIHKFYYSGPMFRYDRPQKGRYRQFYQMGVEIFGGENGFYDGEVILLLDKFISSIGFKDYIIEINSIGCNKCKPIYTEKLSNYLSENLSSFCNDCKIRAQNNVLRVMDCKNQTCQQILKDGPNINDFLCQDCKQHKEQTYQYLKIFSIPYKENPYLVRGLDYYTKTVFEVKISGEENSVAGGGRYDNLVDQLGGPCIPAVGFAIGMDRICEILKNPEKKDRIIWVVFLDEKSFAEGIQIIDKLRKKNIKIIIDYDKRSLKNYLKIVNKQKIEEVFILGENELSQKSFLYKNMKNGTQQLIHFNDITTFFGENL
ncbi:MAG: histidine--tRNA ligase [Candidatus Omnitrophica bacterium]|nr:histidine--tRNA ligase [Candidatus Omnitrophota bacterium]